MPSTTTKQAKYMEACNNPKSRKKMQAKGKSCPTKKDTKEWVAADRSKKRSKK